MPELLNSQYPIKVEAIGVWELAGVIVEVTTGVGVAVEVCRVRSIGSI